MTNGCKRLGERGCGRCRRNSRKTQFSFKNEQIWNEKKISLFYWKKNNNNLQLFATVFPRVSTDEWESMTHDSFSYILLSARPLSAGRLQRQARPPAVRPLFGAQHQDHPWTLPLPLEFPSTLLLPSVHHRSPLALNPSTPSTAARIPSVPPHRSPPGQPVSHPVYPGTTSIELCVYSLVLLLFISTVQCLRHCLSFVTLSVDPISRFNIFSLLPFSSPS